MTARIKVSAEALTGLNTAETTFVVELCKDWAYRRAAEAAGLPPGKGYALAEKPNVAAAIQRCVLAKQMDAVIDAEWLLWELVDNHQIARQAGNINASNTALLGIAKHTMVDAMASDKLNLNLHVDKDVTDRLRRGRTRALKRKGTQPPADEVSFL